MGLSRNKVAVSEGAAGSPPFYGEPAFMKINAQKLERASRGQSRKTREGTRGQSLVVRF